MYEIYAHYGLAPFARASTLSHTEILLYFLHRRLARRSAARMQRTPAAMLALLQKYHHVPPTTRQRHGWLILSVSQRWNEMDSGYYGCGNPGCEELETLLELRKQRVKGVRDPVVEDRLYRWGGASKACKGYVAPVHLGKADGTDLGSTRPTAASPSRTAQRRARAPIELPTSRHATCKTR